jgi:hypothetical protein
VVSPSLPLWLDRQVLWSVWITAPLDVYFNLYPQSRFPIPLSLGLAVYAIEAGHVFVVGTGVYVLGSVLAGVLGVRGGFATIAVVVWMTGWLLLLLPLHAAALQLFLALLLYYFVIPLWLHSWVLYFIFHWLFTSTCTLFANKKNRKLYQAFKTKSGTHLFSRAMLSFTPRSVWLLNIIIAFIEYSGWDFHPISNTNDPSLLISYGSVISILYLYQQLTNTEQREAQNNQNETMEGDENTDSEDDSGDKSNEKHNI